MAEHSQFLIQYYTFMPVNCLFRSFSKGRYLLNPTVCNTVVFNEIFRQQIRVTVHGGNRRTNAILCYGYNSVASSPQNKERFVCHSIFCSHALYLNEWHNEPASTDIFFAFFSLKLQIFRLKNEEYR